MKPSYLAPTIMPRSKSLRSHVFPILIVDIHWSSWPISAWCYALYCCHRIEKFSYTAFHLSRISLSKHLPFSDFRFTLVISYYGLTLNTSNLHGNHYLNCFISAVTEIPAYIACWLALQYLRRRLSLSLSMLLGGGLILLIQLVPPGETHHKSSISREQCLHPIILHFICTHTRLCTLFAGLSSLAISLEMIGKFLITSAFGFIYVYTGELYPTRMRSTAVGICSMVSRVGTSISPYVLHLGKGTQKCLPWTSIAWKIIFHPCRGSKLLFLLGNTDAPKFKKLGAPAKM